MSIEDDVKSAIEEFGDDAHKRFTHKGMAFYDEYCRSNEFLLSMLAVDNIKIKSLPELFAHDVEVYGDNAYQMWETPYSLADECPNEKTLHFLNINKDIGLIVRKTSAALPFDLERAKNSGVFEYFERGGWHTKTSINDFLIDERYLRMKYPPKVQS